MTISPKFGSQIGVYNTTIQVLYDDLTNENVNISIIVEPSYPYFESDPVLLSNPIFGTTSTSQALPKQVY